MGKHVSNVIQKRINKKRIEEEPKFKRKVSRWSYKSFDNKTEHKKYEEGLKRKEERKKLEQKQLEQLKGMKKEKTENQIEKDVLRGIEEGKFHRRNKNNDIFGNVTATDLHDKVKRWPYTHEEWMAYAHLALKHFNNILENKQIPTWELVRYRSENEFKAGIYSAFAPIWMIMINALEDDKIKQIAYRLIFHGVSIFENQATVPVQNRQTYRGKYELCTGRTLNMVHLAVYNKLGEEDRKGHSFRLAGTKYSIFSDYPMEAVKEKGKWIRKPFFQPNSKKVLLSPDDVTESLKDWNKTGAIEYVGPAKEVESPIRAGTVLAINIKPEKIKLRVCFDGEPWSITKKFDVPCVLDTVQKVLLYVEKDDCLTKWDDKSGFHQLKLDEASRNFTHFVWGNHVFQYFAAPFGIGRVPADFQLANHCVVNFLRTCGIPTFVYLDDRLVIEGRHNETEQKLIDMGVRAPKNSLLTNLLMTAVGGYISKAKSTPKCSKRIEFLGFDLDTEKETIGIPERKWDTFQNNLKEMVKREMIFYKDLEKIRGQMCSFLLVVTNMQLYIRESTNALMKSEKEDNPYIRMTSDLKEELKVWRSKEIRYIEKIRSWHPVETKLVTKDIYTDASGYALGWYTEDKNEEYSAYWNVDDGKLNIATKEALAILYYIEHHTEELRNVRTRFLCDNMAVVMAFTKGAREKTLNKAITKINKLAVKLNLIIHIEWCDTKSQKADGASRKLDLNEEIINKDILEEIWEKAGFKTNLDGAATFNNKIHERYISRFPETQAEYTDFMAYTPKQDDVIYLFPPKNAQEFMIKKLLKAGNKFILIYSAVGEIPIFVPFLKRVAEITNISRWAESPTLVPSKKYSEKVGYYTACTKKKQIYCAIKRENRKWRNKGDAPGSNIDGSS